MPPKLNFEPKGELYIDGEKLEATVSEVPFEHDEIPEPTNDIKHATSTVGELSFDCEVNMGVLERAFGIDLARCPDYASFTINQPHLEQIRCHRKRRINKKWAKRYGFRLKFKTIEIKNAQFQKTDEKIYCKGDF